MFKRLLIPLDGSEHSQRALAPAGEFARSFTADVVVVGVIQHPETSTVRVERRDEESRSRMDVYLEEQAAKLREQGISTKVEVRFGNPAAEITWAAAEHDVDLVLMSTHGTGARGRYALGSVALRVLMTAPCPVFLVRIGEHASEPLAATIERATIVEGG